MFEGRLLAIAISNAAALPMQPAGQIEAITGQGLRGDRYAEKKGTFTRGEIQPSQQVTLIESEAIEAAVRDAKLNITHLDTRRNLLTKGVPLNHLVGQTFAIGQVTLRGVKLCEPCGHLEKLTCQGIEKTLRHRGGLRAEIIEGGTLRVGDTIRPAAE